MSVTGFQALVSSLSELLALKINREIVSRGYQGNCVTKETGVCELSGSDEGEGVVVPANRLRPLSPHVQLSVSLVELTVQTSNQSLVVT